MTNNFKEYLNEVNEEVRKASFANKPFILDQPIKDLSLQFIADQINKTLETEQIAVVLPIIHADDTKKQLKEYLKIDHLEDMVKLIDPNSFNKFENGIDENSCFSKCFFVDAKGWSDSNETILNSPYMNKADIIICTCEPTDADGRNINHRFPDAIFKKSYLNEIASLADASIKLTDSRNSEINLKEKIKQLIDNNDTESKTNNLSFRKDDLDL